MGITMKEKPNIISLIEAILSRNADVVKNLLEAGADVNDYEDSERIAPLHFAALSSSLEIVTLLVDYGADVNQMTCECITPLDVAEQSRKKDIISYLKQVGAKQGETLLLERENETV